MSAGRTSLTFAIKALVRSVLTAPFHEARLGDRHDLIHEATGWMPREVGKRDAAALRGSLEEHAARMPRTALRYAIERLPEAERKAWLATAR